MKKSLLIVAIAFAGSSVFAQQSPTDGSSISGKSAMIGEKLNVKSGATAKAKSADTGKSLWVPVGEANKSGKKNLKLDVKGIKQ